MAAAQQATIHLDKSLFRQTLRVVGVRVENKKIGQVVQRLHRHLLNRPRLRNVVPAPHSTTHKTSSPIKATQAMDNSSKLVLLNEKVKDKDTLEGLDHDLIQFLRQESLGFCHFALELDYSYFPVDQVLRKVLPTGLEIPSAFETIGHVAHLNLRDALLPYKTLIGQVILEKNLPRIRTVVNKMDNIETKFRTFPMEILAGDDDLDVEIHENNATFRFNYAQVYWNSRLQHEHERMIQIIDKNTTAWSALSPSMEKKENNKKDKKTDISKPKNPQIVCDMMCGIGPFAIPLAMRGHQVFANDLNPKSYESLVANIQINKLKTPSQIEPFNLDAREFVVQLLTQRKVQFQHVVMNLPATALEFLDVFTGLYANAFGVQSKHDVKIKMPVIHCYCFSNAKDAESDVIARAEMVMKGKLNRDRLGIHLVRDVAPKKKMLCLSFELPRAIAFAQEQVEEENGHQQDAKRRKVE